MSDRPTLVATHVETLEDILNLLKRAQRQYDNEYFGQGMTSLDRAISQLAAEVTRIANPPAEDSEADHV